MRTKLCLLVLLLLAGHGSAQEAIRGRIVGVSDGDNITVLTANQQLLRVRLAFIDAPESGQAFGTDELSSS